MDVAALQLDGYSIILQCWSTAEVTKHRISVTGWQKILLGEEILARFKLKITDFFFNGGNWEKS